MQRPVNELQSYIGNTSQLGNIATQYINFLLKGDPHCVANLILNEVKKKGLAVKDVYKEDFKNLSMKLAGCGFPLKSAWKKNIFVQQPRK